MMSGADRLVGDLLAQFQRVAVALASACEDAGIPWSDSDAYDQWDNLVAAAYDAFVASLLPEITEATLPLAPYDLRQESYLMFSVLVLEGLDTSTVFNRLIPGDDFAVIEALPVDEDWRVTSENSLLIPLAEARVRVVAREA